MDFTAVVNAAEADGALAPEAAAELRRLAYSGAACLADIYAAGSGKGEPDRAAFLARARRALEAAAAAAAVATEQQQQNGAVERAAVQAAVQAAQATSPQQPAPAPATATAAIAAA